MMFYLQPSTSSVVTGASAAAVVVDPSLPVTNIQIRLADGSRFVFTYLLLVDTLGFQNHMIVN